MKLDYRQRLLATTLFVGASMLATPAIAQQTGQQGDESDTPATGPIEGAPQESINAQGEVIDRPADIVVTGTRIPRPNVEAPSPVTVVNSEQVELTGTVTVENLLNELPQVIPGNTRVSNNAGGENFSTLDLRGLGPGRTLILLDGERLPPSTTTGVVDVSQIPVGLIQRVEVVTGGASAVYGSDAIAGVINFILKQNYQGLELVGQTNISEDGTGFSYAINGLMGGNFADDRGNLTVYGSWSDRDAVGQGRYDYSRVSAALFFDPTGAGDIVVADDPSDIPAGYSLLAGGGSATPPYGVVNASALSGTQFRNLSTLLPGTFGSANTDCNAATPGVPVTSAGAVSFDDNGNLSISTGSTGQCAIPLRSIGSSRFNFGPLNYLVTPYDRMQLTTLGHWDFSDRTRLKLYSSYANANQEVNLAPTPATGIVVDVDSPLIPADLATALANRSYFTRTGIVRPGPGRTTGGRFTSLASCEGDAEPNTPGRQAIYSCTEVTSANFNDPTVTAALPNATDPSQEDFIVNRRFTETGPRIGKFKTDSFLIRSVLEHEISPDFDMNFVLGFGKVDNAIRGIGNINRTAVAQGLNGCLNDDGVLNGPGILPGCVPLNIFGEDTIDGPALSFVRVDTQQQEHFEQIRAAVNLQGRAFALPGGDVGIAVGAEYRKDSARTVVDDAQRNGDIYGFNAVQSIEGEIDVKEVYGEILLPLASMLDVGFGARYSDYSSVGGLFNWKAEAEFRPINWVKVRGTYNKAARAPNVFELFQAGDQGFPSFVDPCNANNANRNVAQCLATGVPAGAIDTFNQSNSQVQAFSFGNPNLGEERATTYTIGAVITPANVLGNPLSLTADYYHITLKDRVAAQGAGFFLSQCYSGGVQSACDRIVRDPGTGQVTSIDTTVTNADTDFIVSGVDVGLDWTFDVPFIGGGKFYLSDVFSYTQKYEIAGTNFAGAAFSGIGGVISKYGNTLTAGYRTRKFTGQVRYIWKQGGRQDCNGCELEGFFAEGSEARIPDLHLVNLSLRYAVSDRFEITGIINNLLDKYPPQTATGFFEQANTNVNFYDPYVLGRNYTVQARVRF